MTETEALMILDQYGPITAMEFARLAWPDSEVWGRVKKVGNRNTVSLGTGMSRAALGLLGRLKRKGLVIVKYTEEKSLWMSRHE